jgi:hypothetical protein
LNVALAVALAFAVVGPGSTPAVQGGYTLVIPNGLAMKMTADEAVGVANASLDAMARGVASGGVQGGKPKRITHVIAATGADLADLEPRAAGLVDPLTRKVWLIRAEGQWLQNRGRGPAVVYPTGFMVIDDETGEIIVRGMP